MIGDTWFKVTAVEIPMMPKGVEHDPIEPVIAETADVEIPMMPKGVEHKIRSPHFAVR